MAETDAVDLKGDDDDVRIVSNRVVARDIQIIHLNVSEVCFGLRENMHDSLLAPVLLGDWYTNHWPRIPVSLKFHAGSLSLCVGDIGPLGRGFGSPDAHGARVLVPLLERNLVGLQAGALPRKKQPSHLPRPETNGKCKSSLKIPANVHKPVMSKGKIANILADKNGCLKRPSQTDGLEFNPPTASPNEPWVLLAQVDSEVAVFDTLGEPQKQFKSLPDAGADPRITIPLTKHQKQGLHFMMSKERDRDYTGSKGDTSLGRSSRRGSRAIYKNVIPCDKRSKAWRSLRRDSRRRHWS